MKSQTKHRHFRDADKIKLVKGLSAFSSKIISPLTDECCQVLMKYRHFSRKIVSLFAEKMNTPYKNIGIFIISTKYNSWGNYRHFLQNYFFVYQQIFSRSDEILACFTKNGFFVCRENEWPDKNIGKFYNADKISFSRKLSAFFCKWFLHLPTNFLRFWWNIGIFHKKWPTR